MKNIILIATAMLFGTVGFAQIKVVAPTGDTKIGDTTVAPTEKLHVAGKIKADEDVISQGLVIQNSQSGSASFERIGFSAFAMGAGVRAGFTTDKNFDMDFRQNTRTNVLNRQISTGTLLMRLKKDGNVGIGNVSNPAEKLHVDGNVLANNISVPSDKRLKSNVSSFDYGLEEVLQLKTIRYKYNGEGGIHSKDEHYGVYAQELQSVAPLLVSDMEYIEEDDEGRIKSQTTYLKINDTSIKWMLVNAIQDQQDLIAEKEERISKLEEKLENLEAKINSVLSNQPNQKEEVAIETKENGLLEQNAPNPFSNNTSIKYRIPENSNFSVINILDINGRLLKTYPVLDKSGVLNINAFEFPAGTYIYNLVIDNKIIDTKKMLLTN